MRDICLIAQRLAQLPHTDDGHDVAHRRIRPDGVEQFFLRDQLPGVFD
jgi:hypothetical protein